MEDFIAFEGIRKTLKWFKLYPENGDWTHYQKYLRNFMVPFTIIFLPSGVGMIMFFYMSCREGKIFDQIDSLSIMIQFFLILSLTIFTFVQGVRLNHVEKFVSDLSHGVPKYYMEVHKISEILSVIVVHFTNFMILSYCAFHYFNNTYCQDMFDKKFVCRGSYPLWYPFEIESQFIIYWIILSSVLSMLMNFFFGIVMTFLILASTVLFALKINHLSCMLMSLKEYRFNSKLLEKNFNKCLSYYNALVKFNIELNGAFKYSTIPFVLFAPVLMAMFTYRFVATGNLMTLMNLLCWMIICVMTLQCGQFMESMNSKLILATYDVPWIQMNTKTKRKFLIFLKLLHKPFSIDILFVGGLNNVLLLRVFKSFYTFLMFILQITSKN